MNFRETIENIKEGQTYECEGFTIECLDNGTIEIRYKGKIFGFEKGDAFARAERSVSFNSVLNSDKRCRIEHELLKDNNRFSSYRYMGFLLRELTECYCTDEVKRILREGKWYLED